MEAMTSEQPNIEDFRAEVQQWLASVTTPREQGSSAWGVGSDTVALFDNLSEADERVQLEAGREWEKKRFDAGYNIVSWPVEYGGRNAPNDFALVADAEEAQFNVPRRTELFDVTRHLIPVTVEKWGTEAQKAMWVRSFLRCDEFCCQLFSEPGAGSDLANVSTKATRDGDMWVLSGQKVWTSSAVFADWGLAICRSDSSGAKHAGMTAFMVKLDTPGVTVRPIRQMTGGASFNEVFLDDVRVSDDMRLGPVGEGWKVALTTLSAERSSANSLGGDALPKVLALVKHLGLGNDPIVRQKVAEYYTHMTVHNLNELRVAASVEAGGEIGPEGSIGRLSCTLNLTRTSKVVSALLGTKLVADTGEWGTYAWAEQVLGAPGYRIAGGSEEIQHNIIGERVLGLPREPR
jgi:alkylation response protein AidB-like acyl-CoA dehydrogenase